MEAESSSRVSEILLMRWDDGGEVMVGRRTKGLGEGVRLGFRNADFNGVFTGRGLSTGVKGGLVVGVFMVAGEFVSPFRGVARICLIAGFSGLRTSKVSALIDLEGGV